jgi:hypothetical protein
MLKEIASTFSTILENVRSFTVGVGVGVGVGVCVTVGVGVAVDSGVGDGEGMGVGVATCAGFLIATPLFHTSFVPDLTQVNFFPPDVAVAPTFTHLAPALGVAAWTGAARVTNKVIAINR